MNRIRTTLVRPAASLALALAVTWFSGLPAPSASVHAQTTLPGTARAPAKRTVPNEHSVYLLESRWTTDAGRTVQLAQLSGQYQILAFIFTGCTAACPLLVKSLQIQARSLPQTARQRARFTLISIDPEQDTVAALRRYRKTMALDEQWTLLRGSENDVRELAAVVGFNYQRIQAGQFAHSNQVTLLDPSGEIVLQHPSADGALQAFSETIVKHL